MRKNYTNPSMSLLKYEAADKIVMLSLAAVQSTAADSVDVKVKLSEVTTTLE